MKRFLAALLVFLLAPMAVFADRLPSEEIVDGNSVLGVFHVADAEEQYLQFWKDFKASDRNLMLAAPGGIRYYFIIVPEGATVTIEDASSGISNLIRVRISKPYAALEFSDQPNDPRDLRITGYITTSGILPNTRYLVTGSYFTSQGIKIPTLSYKYLVEHDGTLMLEDDLEDEPTEDVGILGFLKKLWDWICSFFETLKNMIIGLFVPGEGFFSKWFEEIRDAFSKKMGGLGDVFTHIKDSFGRLRGDSGDLVISLPAGSVYSSFQGISVNLSEYLGPLLKNVRPLLTTLVVIITAVMCYRRLKALANT